MQSRLRKIPNLWYFLAEIEELEQKSGSETEKALQMLSGSDLLTLGRAFLELQKSEWSILNNYEKLTFRAFQQHIIVHTLLQIRRPKTGVQRQYFLAEIEELEQKFGSEIEKALQMLSGSDLLTLGRAFLELQKSKWSILNNYGKLTFRAFQQCIIVHTLLQIRRPKTGVQRQPPAPLLGVQQPRSRDQRPNTQRGPLASVQRNVVRIGPDRPVRSMLSEPDRTGRFDRKTGESTFLCRRDPRPRPRCSNVD